VSRRANWPPWLKLVGSVNALLCFTIAVRALLPGVELGFWDAMAALWCAGWVLFLRWRESGTIEGDAESTSRWIF